MKVQIFLLVILAVWLSGCATEKRCARRFPVREISETVVQHDTITRVRDTLIPLPADSGLIRALLECREGKVVVREIIETKPGKRVVPFFRLENNQLTAGAKIDSSAIYFAWKETHIRQTKTEIKTIEKMVYRVSGFQNFLIWTGGFSWAILLLIAGFFLVRFFAKRKILP